MHHVRRAITGLVVIACATLGAQQSRSSWSGVYTTAQAVAGEKVYSDKCASCHGADLAGIERAPALAGGTFLNSWDGSDLRRLLERIDTMPPAAPKSLSSAESGALLAFLLRAAEMPAGPAALSADRAQLAGITFERTRSAVVSSAQESTRATIAPAAATAAQRPPAPTSGATLSWPTYGGNLASHRYSPADQITRDNFNNLQIAWRLKTDFLGPRPDTLYSATPLLVDRVLYTTAGMRRAVIALNPTSGEMLWMHSEDEGRRGQNAIRNGAGRGLAYWASADGADRRIVYVTPGYRLKALDAKTGIPVPGFGRNGVVDLKTEIDQDGLDLDTAELGLNATPLVVGDVIVVGAAHRPGSNPRTMRNVKGYVRGYDVRTGKRLWIFHTIPQRGEFGYDTWLEGSAEYNGNTGVWAQMSADPELGLVYVPVEMPTGDYYGGNRPGDNLFADSLVALDVKTGKRKWHYQTVHHDVWDWDLACAPILFDVTLNGRTVKAIAQPTKHAFLFVFNRETGQPIWPIEERAVPQSNVPRERTSPTQPFPTKPAPFDRQGISEQDLLDLTPALKAEAIEVAGRYKMGPLFTPPVVSSLDGPLATMTLPSEVGGANWPGGSFDPNNNFLYVHSHANVYMNALVPANPAQSDMGYVGGQARAGGPGGGAARGAGPGDGAARGAGARGGRAGTVQGLPLIKPTGEADWAETIVDDESLFAQWVSMGPGKKTPRRMNGDTREWWIVQSGTLRFTIEGREPLVATRGFMVQVPYRTLYQIENVGTEPALRFEVNVARARKLYPTNEAPVPVPGFEYIKTRVTGGTGTLNAQNRPFLDFSKAVSGQERGGAFVTDDRSFANIIMGNYQRPQPGNKGHFHEEGGEFWLICLGTIRYNIEGLPEFEAQEGDVVYVPRQTWHLASNGGKEGLRSCRLAMNGFPYQAHMFEQD